MLKLRTTMRSFAVFAAAICTLTAGATPAAAATSSFTDGADDAYRLTSESVEPLAAQPANPVLSDPTADILSVTFTNVAAPRKQLASYTASMTITGTPSASYSYVAAGDFGDDCNIYHLLTPNNTARANAFCMIGGTYTFIGSISGSAVSVNGSTTTATFTFDPKRLPAQLKADRELGPLHAFTCVSGDEGRGCRSYEKLDVATGLTSSFTI